MAKRRAGIYCRISDDAKGTGLGVARQEKDCRQLAKKLGATIVDVWTDNDISAFSGKKRPGYLAACDAIESGAIDLLIVWHPDRLHRSPAELETFVAIVETAGAQVSTVTAGEFDLATPEGRLVARITGAVARKESEDKSRRLRRKQEELREHGKPTGRLGYPYLAGGEIDPARAAIITELAARIVDGESLSRLATELNERNVPTTLGGRWTHTTLRVVMSAPSLAGLATHGGKIIGAGTWSPVLDRLTWERVRAAIASKPRRASGVYLLSNIARCELCGSGLTGASRIVNGQRMHLYGCNKSSGGCGRVWINRERLDGLTVPRIEAALADPDLRLGAVPTKPADLDAKIAKTEGQLVAYAEMVDAGEIEMIEWRTLRAKATDRLNLLRAQQAADDPVAPFPTADAWPTMPVHRRRQVIGALMEITVGPAKHRGARHDDERVSIRWLA